MLNSVHVTGISKADIQNQGVMVNPDCKLDRNWTYPGDRTYLCLFQKCSAEEGEAHSGYVGEGTVLWSGAPD